MTHAPHRATDALTPVLPQAPNQLAKLSRQQVHVLDLTSQGMQAREVAARLDISISAVKFHKTNIYKALNVRSIIEALIVYEKFKFGNPIELIRPYTYRTSTYTKIKNELDVLKPKYEEAERSAAYYKDKYYALIKLQSQGAYELSSGAGVSK